MKNVYIGTRGTISVVRAPAPAKGKLKLKSSSQSRWVPFATCSCSADYVSILHNNNYSPMNMQGAHFQLFTGAQGLARACM